jgi:hypothetical protein
MFILTKTAQVLNRYKQKQPMTGKFVNTLHITY